ncbi:MAG: RNA-binding domain-containing protein [Candidatus Odinarchaeia archaeon]
MSIETIEIEIKVKLNLTEDKNKVMHAVGNIIDLNVDVEILDKDKELIFHSKNINALKPLYDKWRAQRILETARDILLTNAYSNSTTFYINKQAAYVNKIHLCEPEGESPLGPIIVTLYCENIGTLINWLTPHTVDGKPVTQEKGQIFFEDLEQ